MKRILAIAFMLCAVHFSTQAQQIIKREYFIDKDPGPGKGTALVLSARDTTLDTLTFPTTGLGIGFHRIYLRYRNTVGSWGITEDRLFYIFDTIAPVFTLSPSISNGEYFIDNDPGPGQGIALPSFTAADTFTQTLTIPTTGLKTGFHRIYVRYRDLNRHNWGIAEDRLIYVYDTLKPFINTTPHVIAGEYFIDNVTTFGAGTSFSIPTPADSITYTLSLNTTGLSAGTHQVWTHFRDSANHWGFMERMQFVICTSPLPGPVITGKTNYCTGDSIKLSGASVTGASNYFWKGPSGFTSTNLNIYVVNADSTKNSGVYSLYATRSGGTACDTSSISTDTVIVNSKPTANAGSAQTVCSGSTATIGSKAIGTLTYSWASSPTGFTSTVANPTVSPTVTTTYIVTATNKAGCGNTASVIVTVNALPKNDAGTNSTICPGSPATIGTVQTAGNKYSWVSSPTGFSSTIANPSVSPTVATIYILTETNTTGCTRTDSVTIALNPLPSATTGSSQAVCNSGSLTIGSSATSGHNYSWTSNPVGFTSTSSNPTVSPTTSTTYTLTETITATGCSNSASVAIFVNPQPNANVGTPQTICYGDSAKIGAAIVSGDSYSWVSSPAGFTSSLSNPYVSPTTATTYTLTETVGTCTKSNSVVVSVNAGPTPVVGSFQTICSGTPATLGASAVSGLGYSWTSNPSGFTSTNAAPTVNPIITTVYHLTATLLASGCARADSVTITVNPLPTAGVGNPQATCNGGSIVIGLSAVNGYNYSWTSNPAGFTSASANPTVNPVVTTIYKLTETDATTGCVRIDSVKVSVNPQPNANVGNPQTLCSGDSIKIGATSVSGDSYNWVSSNAGFTSSISNPYVNPNTTTTYTLTESVGSCTQSNSVVVTVNPAPSPVAGPSQTVCSGATVSLGSVTTTGDSYGWASLPSGFSASGSYTTAKPLATTKYILTETISATGCHKADTATIVVNPSPAPRAGLAVTVCTGKSIIIGLASVGGYTYNWTSNPVGFTSASANPNVSPKVNTIYRLTETIVATGCSSTDSIKVTVSPLPNPGWFINYFGDEAYLHANDSSFSNTSYNWDFGDGAKDSVSGHLAKHLYPNNKPYLIKLKVTNAAGCASEFDSTYDITVSGIAQSQMDLFHLNIFPNPFQTSTIVEYSLAEHENVKISLFDLTGKQIAIVANETQQPGNYQLDLNAEKYHLQPGMYMLKFITDNGYVSRSIVKF